MVILKHASVVYINGTNSWNIKNVEDHLSTKIVSTINYYVETFCPLTTLTFIVCMYFHKINFHSWHRLRKYSDNENFLIYGIVYMYLCDTYRSRAHANPEGIHSSINQILGLLCCHNVTTDHLEIWVTLFDIFDHVDLEDWIALRRILYMKLNLKHVMVKGCGWWEGLVSIAY